MSCTLLYPAELGVDVATFRLAFAATESLDGGAI
jgi:hypothetical protein